MSERYDAIVVGVGGMGSATAWQLARRGKKVLGLEQFDIPHASGSSHGINRIIRLAYYEDPRYVPLLKRAYQLWRELEASCGEHLLHITGSIDASEPDGIVFTGALESCRLHGLSHEVLTSAELTRRFPGYRLPADHLALYQEDGGFLLSERCIVQHVEEAMKLGAEIHGREEVLDWTSTGNGLAVHTTRAVYRTGKLIFTAGAWMGRLLDDLAPLLTPERQVLAWLQPLEPVKFTPDTFPVFNLTVPEGRYYGFPVYGNPGFKIGRYHHLDEAIDPTEPLRPPDRADEEILRAFVSRYTPAANGHALALRTCIFTNSPDEHFIIDTLPDDERVIVASPCSGHGYKFCSVIGEILADLAIEGTTQHDISLFRLDRFQT
ncbi:MAG TPA: N-methyl-L-tryptophan oxidase [Thermomicrobiales bacterium]|nr:N-methyl-L-tryptophan oxidase [Thermomicrobiales bacterium]